MSYILDALRRAERERNLGQAPDLQTIAQPPQYAAPARRWPWLALILAALLFAAALVLLLIPRAAPPTDLKSEPEPAAASAAPAASPAQTTAEPESVIADGERLDTLDDLAAPVESPGLRTIPLQPADVTQPSFADGELSPEILIGERRAAAAAAPPAPAPAPKPAPPPVQTSTPSVTPLRDMPPAYRAEFPQFSVDVHVYNDDPARRFVLVDLRRYKEGESLPQGPKIAEITPDGIIFSYRGSEVLYLIAR